MKKIIEETVSGGAIKNQIGIVVEILVETFSRQKGIMVTYMYMNTSLLSNFREFHVFSILQYISTKVFKFLNT